jgi:hypothetical protein
VPDLPKSLILTSLTPLAGSRQFLDSRAETHSESRQQNPSPITCSTAQLDAVGRSQERKKMVAKIGQKIFSRKIAAQCS